MSSFGAMIASLLLDSKIRVVVVVAFVTLVCEAVTPSASIPSISHVEVTHPYLPNIPQQEKNSSSSWIVAVGVRGVEELIGDDGGRGVGEWMLREGFTFEFVGRVGR